MRGKFGGETEWGGKKTKKKKIKKTRAKSCGEGFKRVDLIVVMTDFLDGLGFI